MCRLAETFDQSSRHMIHYILAIIRRLVSLPINNSIPHELHAL